MKYTLKQLKADVTAEADAIKKHATPEEISLLNFSRLEPTNRLECIYGQMTGDCFSDRAAHLVLACAARYVHDCNIIAIQTYGFKRIAKNMNGTIVEDFINKRVSFHSDTWEPYFSPIEAYILLPQAKSANLIAYIKNETQTLKL